MYRYGRAIVVIYVSNAILRVTHNQEEPLVRLVGGKEFRGVGGGGGEYGKEFALKKVNER